MRMMRLVITRVKLGSSAAFPVRELNIYAELMPSTSKLADLEFKPKGIILSGSPHCEICWNHKGRVAKCDHHEYGLTEVQINADGDQPPVMPPDFHVIGRTSTTPYAAIAV
ncbi:hypothetical protein CY34DRAFT_17228 [Suillus luteus UH-Slu-Lm8-n1]|uniref:Uncharacterized protein n=1 Tax=Suillus luteus UH-Slu-Lm8-n1 TaxID=930992 RepID=A0A0D0AAK3_9AGAM|nr:hypothetical protein CY34DRAFT_17228 [Suillus luteus UH-Slu-Lm8-n1]